MTAIAEARMPTANADKYAAQLGTLDVRENILVVRIQASEEAQSDGLNDALERHIDRFAFRETPLQYKRQDVPAGEAE